MLATGAKPLLQGGFGPWAAARGVSMLDLLFVALFQAASGDPTTAAPAETAPAAAPEQAATQPAPAQQRRRCRNVRYTGSYMPQRVCTTQAEDERREDNMRRDLDRTIERPDPIKPGPFDQR